VSSADREILNTALSNWPADEPLLSYPPELPITEKRESIVRAIGERQVLVITGETGSGKSTQIPKMCLEAGRGVERRIGCTQPRRIAAITLANRVAEELGETRADWVGYKIRFQDRTARSTRIKFMTDGILLAEAQRDRLFRAYDTLIIDEAHERSLNIDFLLGLIQKILPRRPDLKVIITSATIDPEKFSVAFGGAPIIEVSGRTYPVDVRYRPPKIPEGENEETSYVDEAIDAVDELKASRGQVMRGDVLIFMPTESDIRETVQRLEEKRYRNTLVLPLYGRMAAADQQRIFRPTLEEKIVVATNVAETSITIPRIRFVIDTGLARTSQYNARSRTRALPIVPVSMASADQRKGRCGRVRSGICIRLYSKEDYLNRPPFTPPEISRANLAEVILRMLFLHLGSIQDFPFLDPPAPAAVKDGFAVLNELSAVDDHRKLTDLGRKMAQLPLDPRLARILLEAQKEGALRELMVIAAALSIQDPRERPLEKEAQADQVHAVFRDPRSDFVALLKIWEKSKVLSLDSRSQSRGELRRFCRDHFLSYRRMREWRDVHNEIREILEDLGELKIHDAPASYEAIHRAVASGYLSHIAMRKEKNFYIGTKNRRVMLFPGSGVFNKGGAWIIAGELVHTTRLYARTVAGIQPEWLEELGGHLCRASYSEPHWEKKRGQVVAIEKVTLYGLPVVSGRKVDYGRVHPEEAREIFLRSGLIEEDLPRSYGFLEHNRLLIRRIEELESKARRRDLLVDGEALYRFYDRRIPPIADLASFNKFLKDQGGDQCLRMTEKDLLQSEPDFKALEQFPDVFPAGGLDLPLRYAFHPGEEDDGVTVIVPVHALSRLSPADFDRVVPGMISEKVMVLLKSLPKSVRRRLVPVGETAQRILDGLILVQGDFYVLLSGMVQGLTGTPAPFELWDRQSLPPHLLMRFEVVGPDGAILGAGRNLEDLKSLTVERYDDGLWETARKVWEKEGLTSWDFGDLPRVVEVGKDGMGLPRYAYPGLVDEGTTLAVRLFDDPEKAGSSNRHGLMLLYRLAFASELKQLKKDWVFPERASTMSFFLGSRKEANRQLQEYIMRELFGIHAPLWPERPKFDETVKRLKGKLAQLASEITEEVLDVIKEHHATRSDLDRFRKMALNNRAALNRFDVLNAELERLVPPDFLEHSRRPLMRELPRYLRGLRVRGERVYVAPEKDVFKAEQLVPHQDRYQEMRQDVWARPNESGLAFLDEFGSMLEEFRINLFAPEIRTRFRVSAKRLDEKWKEWISTKGCRA
jgi:ATP-dependent helicase HrpA